MNGPELALAACRFVHDAAGMLLWGAFGFLATLVPPALADAIGRSLSRMRVGAVLLAALATGAMLPVEVAAIGDGWASSLDRDTVGAVLTETSVGHAWQIHAVAAVILVATLGVPARRRRHATAAAAALLLASVALTGHAAAHAGWAGWAQRLVDGIHVLAAGAWIGALVPLLVVLGRLDRAADRDAARRALRRFSTTGHGVVAVVLATGVGNMLLVVDGWPDRWTSPYRVLLAVKIALALAMTTLALADRYLVVPRMACDRDRSIGLLRRGTLVEIGLGVAAIGCVSVFGLLDPG